MIAYLSLAGIARKTGKKFDTIKGYWQDGRLPEPDAVIGKEDDRPKYGWLPETIERWDRPGQGARTDRR